jgi:hypothetical protein
MRNNKDSRQQIFCRACGLIIVDSVCPYCNSTIDEPVARNSRGVLQPRFAGITGVFLLVLAGVTPVVVSAKESTKTAVITTERVVVSTTTSVLSTTTSSAPVSVSTSTSLAQTSTTNPVQKTVTPTTQQPKKKKSPPTGSVEVVPSTSTSTSTSTTTAVPSGPHGKKEGRGWFWRDGAGLEIGFSVGRFRSGDGYVIAMSSFESAKNVDRECSSSSAPIYKYESFHSIDGGTTVKRDSVYQIPQEDIGNDHCDLGGIVISRSGFDRDRWYDTNGRAVAVPVNFHAKVRLTNLRSGEVAESPWVLIDWSQVP